MSQPYNDAFMLALDAWVANDTEETRQALKTATDEFVDIWAQASREYESLTYEHTGD